MAFGARNGYPTKVGLYTGPHLIHRRERIRLGAQPISESLFAKYFFEVWDKFGDETDLPRYLQLMTLVSFHAFLSEKVDVAIYETHCGGEYDATNALTPSVTGITCIGLDHVGALGPSITDVAWHKAGIFHHSASAFSSPQQDNVAKVLRARAAEKSVSLDFTGIDARVREDVAALKPHVQKINFSLAISLVNSFLESQPSPSSFLTQGDIDEAARLLDWPGRFQVIRDGKLEWYLDGAHNELSIPIAAEWYAGAAVNSMR